MGVRVDSHAPHRHGQAVEVRTGAKSEGDKTLSAESYQMGF